MEDYRSAKRGGRGRQRGGDGTDGGEGEWELCQEKAACESNSEGIRFPVSLVVRASYCQSD